MTNSSASIISHNLVDVFGVLRYQQGSAQTPWRWAFAKGEAEEIVLLHQQPWLNSRSIWLAVPPLTVGGVRLGSNLTASITPGMLRPVVTPVCIGCLAGFAAPLLALIFDCGVPNPFSTQWRDCVDIAADAFWEACREDAICRGVAYICGGVCGGAFEIALEKPEKPDTRKRTKPVKKRADITRQ